MAIGKGYLVLAAKLEEAAMMHSNVRARLADAVNDAHKGSGSYGYYLDHNGDGESGDVIYSSDGDVRSAPYTLGSANGKQTANIDTENSKNVVPRTTYEEEADDDDQYAGMEEAGLYTAGPKPTVERFISKDERANADGGSFAGKGKSFPILKAGDVTAAVHAMGRAGSGNYGMSTLKANIIRIAKAKGFGNMLPKSWQGDSSADDPKESFARKEFKLSAGEVELRESASFLGAVKLTESATRTDYPVKLIGPGWGSSGYYSPKMLERDGPNTFGPGTLMFWNHQTAAEESARPEGNMSHLAGVVTSKVAYDPNGKEGPGLYGHAKVFSDYAEKVSEKAPYTGLSIRAAGTVKQGEAEGRKGSIIERLTHGESVDFVTRPGAKGKVLTEAARTSQSNEGEEDMTEAEVKALIREATLPLSMDNKKLRERLALREAGPLAIEALANINLPRSTKERIVRRLAEAAPTTDTGELDVKKLNEMALAEAKDEADYLERLGFGTVQGLGAAVAAGDPKKLDEAFDAEYDEVMKQMAEHVVGDGKENKDKRKAFVEGRAA